ncbi:hypothetical protein SAMN05216284_110244 [Micromonospora sediminimaris]|nr:hypothetical protein SAMN05216284_110244 [Micromonospora sediminimaris]
MLVVEVRLRPLAVSFLSGFFRATMPGNGPETSDRHWYVQISRSLPGGAASCVRRTRAP